MNYKHKRNAFTTLSDPNSTEEQWLAALQEILIFAPACSSIKAEPNSEARSIAEKIIGFVAAIGILLFINLLIPHPSSQNLGPLCVMSAIFSGLTKDTKSSVWRGFSNGLIITAIFLSFLAIVQFKTDFFWLFCSIPTMIVSYFLPGKLKTSADGCNSSQCRSETHATEKTVLAPPPPPIASETQTALAIQWQTPSSCSEEMNVMPLRRPSARHLVCVETLREFGADDLYDSLELQAAKIRQRRRLRNLNQDEAGESP